MDIYDHSLHKNRNWIWPRLYFFAALYLRGFFFYADFLLHAKAVYALSRASSDLLFYKTDKKVFRVVIYLSPIFLRDELTDMSRCSEMVTHHFKRALPWRCHGTFKLRA
jgi:hypothetical protein